jgi:hypothetical protein
MPDTLDEVFDAADALYQSFLQMPDPGQQRSIRISVGFRYPNPALDPVTNLPPPPPDPPVPGFQYLQYSPARTVSYRELSGGTVEAFLPPSFSGTITAEDIQNAANPQLTQVQVTLAAPRLVTWRPTANPFMLYVTVPGYPPLSLDADEIGVANWPGNDQYSLIWADLPSLTFTIYSDPFQFPLPSGPIGRESEAEGL